MYVLELTLEDLFTGVRKIVQHRKRLQRSFGEARSEAVLPETSEVLPTPMLLARNATSYFTETASFRLGWRSAAADAILSQF